MRALLRFLTFGALCRTTFGGGARRSPCPPALLACVAAVLFFAAPAYAGTGTPYSGVTSMTFQDGVAPTADYTGCEDTFINSSAADSGDNFGASDSLYLSGPSNATNVFRSEENRILIKFDISALPDSAIIQRAILSVYQAVGNTGSATDSIEFARVLPPWTEGVGTGTASVASATWTTRHADDSPSDVYTGGGWTANGCSQAGGTTELQWTSTDTTAAGAFTGSDTLDVLNSSVVAIDRTFGVSVTRAKTGAAATSKVGRVAFNITNQVQRWHIGANTNNGAILKMHNNGLDKRFIYFSSEYVDANYRPSLTVYYIDPTVIAGSGGGTGNGRRVIGGGTGAVH